MTGADGRVRCRAVALDFGGYAADQIDHLIGQKPVDSAAAAALRILHDDLGLRIILAMEHRPGRIPLARAPEGRDR